MRIKPEAGLSVLTAESAGAGGTRGLGGGFGVIGADGGLVRGGLVRRRIDRDAASRSQERDAASTSLARLPARTHDEGHVAGQWDVVIRDAGAVELPVLQGIDVATGQMFRDIGMPEVAEYDPWPALTLTTFEHVPWNAPYYARLGFRILDDAEVTPGLRAIRQREAEIGLDRWPRVCMRRDLPG